MRPLAVLIALLLALSLVSHATASRHARFTAPLASTHLAASSRVVWYSRTEAPQGWTQLSPAESSASLSFTLVVEGSNADELERRFWSRSDPDSEEFGEWTSNADIERLVAPSPADTQRLYDALAEHGIAARQVVSHGDSFDVACNVEQASSLFNTRFYHFLHQATGTKTIRQWGDYSLPAALAEQAELVLGVHTFPTSEQRLAMRARRAAMQRRAREAVAARPLPDGWVPQALAAVYGLPYPIAPLAYSEVSAAVIEWEEETFSPSDLLAFSNDTAVPVAPVDAHQIVGNDSVAGPGIEASLDIQVKPCRAQPFFHPSTSTTALLIPLRRSAHSHGLLLFHSCAQWLEGLNPGSTPWFWLVDQPEAWSDKPTARAASTAASNPLINAALATRSTER